MQPPVRPRTTHAVIALGVTQIIGWGTTFYLPALLSRPIAEALSLPVPWVWGAYCWAMLISGFLSRRIGALIDRLGAAPLMSGASLITAFALWVMASAGNGLTLWLAWTLIGLGMRAILYDGAFAALAALEGSGARRSISLLTLMGGLASTVFWPVSHLLLETVGWRDTLLIYAALNIAVCAPLHYFFAGCVRQDAPRQQVSPSGADDSSSATPRVRPELAVVLIATAFAFHAFIWSSLAVHMPALLQGFGLTAALAVAVASMLGPAQVVSRSAELFAQRWLSPLSLTIPVFAMLPISLVPLSLPGDPLILASVFVLSYGLSNGLLTILRGTLPLTIIGSRGYGELLGRIAGPALVVSALSPLVFGQILETWGPRVGIGFLFGAGLASTATAAALIRLARR